MKIENFISYEQPTNYIVHSDQYTKDGQIPVLTAGQSFVLGYTDEEDGIYTGEPVVIFDDFTTSVQYVDFPFKVKSSAMKILKNKQNANIKFCYYLLSWLQKMPPNHKRQWISTTSQIDVNLPPIEWQKKIVQKIEAVSNIIKYRKEELKKLDELVSARFVELFGDPMTDVSKWRASTIGEQFNVASGGTPATGEKAYWENGTIPWIGSNMCQDTILSENDGKFITEEGYAHSSAKWFHKGTVLVALVGATIGKTALLRFDTTTNQNIAAIDVTQNAAFSSEFVFYHMQMLYSKFMEIGSGKFKMANQDFIRQLPLICPPIELQEQFAAFVEQTDKSKVVVSTNIVYNIKRIKT